MRRCSLSARPSAVLLAGCVLFGSTFLGGCGLGMTDSAGSPSEGGAAQMGGVLHGGPNPIVGATVTLYVTKTTAVAPASTYGSAANAVATTTTDGDGSFNLPTVTSTNCPAGEYAYVGAYGGNTGANATSTATNTTTFLMVPIGECSANYGTTGYKGPSPLWINEITTAVSAYALGNFMSLTPNSTTNVVDVNIGSPVNNHATANASTPAAAGLAHAFANALALVNITNGVPKAFTLGGSNASTGGVIPTAEIYLIGNVLQACVNTNGLVAGAGAVTPTATANDGSGCGKLFSVTTPPGGTTPTNTLQAVMNLAKYPNPFVNTWNSECTSAGTGTTTGTSCLFDLATPQAAYANFELSSAPPDWTLAVVYSSGYGAVTTGCTGTCAGLAYPYNLALDYQDDVYVLNWADATPSSINFVGLGNDGTHLFATPQQTTYKAISNIGTDTAGHFFGINFNATAANEAIPVYSTADGSLATTVTSTSALGASGAYTLADPLNNIYVISNQSGISARKLTYAAGSPPTYAISTVAGSGTTAGSSGFLQVSYGKNLDMWFVTGPSSSPLVYCMSNGSTYTKGTPAAATYGAFNGSSGASLTGITTNAFGIGGLSTGNAVAITSSGAAPITKGNGSLVPTVGTAVPLTAVNTSTGLTYNRGTAVDGANTVFAIDGANGSYTSGASVYDASGHSLGTYKGCLVTGKICGSDLNGTSNGPSAVLSPRGIAIDSSGDVWIASGSSANVTEFLGVAAPTWPGRSLGLQGEPQ